MSASRHLLLTQLAPATYQIIYRRGLGSESSTCNRIIDVQSLSLSTHHHEEAAVKRLGPKPVQPETPISA